MYSIGAWASYLPFAIPCAKQETVGTDAGLVVVGRVLEGVMEDINELLVLVEILVALGKH